jgi:hypothetical protein
MPKIAARAFLASAFLASAFLALSFGTPVRASEGDVPRLDVGPTCRPIDRNDAHQIDTARCLKTENEARDQLARQWTEFPSADRTLCTQTASMGGMASYVGLLTCLEMKRDVARLPADRGLRSAPTGLNTKP